MSRGFTLVELLVVVTIVVVLLAMLTPAIDRAIYRTELALCATKLKTIGGAMTLYAAAHNRWYPHNFYYERNLGWHAPLLRHGGGAAALAGQMIVTGVPQDLRSLFRPYLDINKTLIDPMIKPLPVPLDTADHNLVYGSYSLWNGWKWTVAQRGSRRQAKIGDRFDWTDPAGRRYEWDILAGDFMRANLSDAGVPDGGYWTCHPPPRLDTSRLALVNGPTQTGTLSLYSFWIGIATGRDPVDYNVVRQDGAVQFLEEVAYDDERLVDTPEYSTGAGDQDLYHQLPVR